MIINWHDLSFVQNILQKSQELYYLFRAFPIPVPKKASGNPKLFYFSHSRPAETTSRHICEYLSLY